MCCGCSEKYLFSAIAANQGSGLSGRNRPSECLSLDLRGTSSANQPEFLEDLPDSAGLVKEIEILTCDRDTMECIQHWISEHGFVLRQVEEEKGFQRILLYKVNTSNEIGK